MKQKREEEVGYYLKLAKTVKRENQVLEDQEEIFPINTKPSERFVTICHPLYYSPTTTGQSF